MKSSPAIIVVHLNNAIHHVNRPASGSEHHLRSGVCHVITPVARHHHKARQTVCHLGIQKKQERKTPDL